MMDKKDQELQKVQQLKTLLESEKEEFLSVMSHELRTPMTGVKGYLSMILDGDAGDVSEQVKEYVAEAYVANDRLIRLVERMLEISKLQEKKFDFKIQKLNWGQQVEQVVKDCQVRIDEKKQKIEYLKPAEDLWVMGDPDRSREVLLTLVVNAHKFTPTGGKIKITHHDEGNFVVTDVTDTGIGISKEEQERTFQLFSKGNLTLTGQQRGTGIGLYLARQLAEGQNGKVWLEESTPKEGSTFSFALPRA